MTNDADRPENADPVVEGPDGEEPSVLTEAAEVVAAAEAGTCAVCEKPIEPGSDTVEAAYGTVHAEPCSHQGKVV